MTSEIDKLKHFHIEACPNCVFNNYFCHGLLCNIVLLIMYLNVENNGKYL